MISLQQHRLPLILLIALCSMLLVAACGNNNGNKSQTKAQQGVPTTVMQPTATAGPGQQRLNKMADKINKAKTLHGLFHIEIAGQNLPGTLDTEIWKQAPDKNRSIIQNSTISEVPTGSLSVSNGKQIWEYDPNKKIVYEGTVSTTGSSTAQRIENQGISNSNGGIGQSLLNLIEIVMTQSSGTAVTGTTMINGHATEDVHVVPQSDSINNFNYTGDIYIDKTSDLPVRLNLIIDGVGKITLTVETLDLNTSIPASQFNYTPPQGTTVQPLSAATNNNNSNNSTLNLAEAQKQAGFHLLSIPATQNNYTLNGVTALGIPGDQTFSLNYMEGNIPFTIAEGKALANLPASGQQVTVGNSNGTLTSSQGKTTLSWTKNGIGFRISGDLGSDTIVAIANLLT